MASQAPERPWAMIFDGPGLPLARRSFDWPSLRPGEVLVRVRLATLCGSDLHTFSGRRAGPTPGILGHEAVGEIAALGPGAGGDLTGRQLAVGDRVTWSMMVSCGTCFHCQHGLPQKCATLRKYGHAALEPGWELHGGLATHVLLLPGTSLVALPEDLPDEVACPANCAAATVAAAWRVAGLRAGEVACIHGAGMLGLTACAMAAAAGAAVVLVDPDPRRLSLAAAFGARAAVGEGDDLTGVVAGLTAGRGADLALDVSGHPAALAAGLQTLRVGGRAVWVGSVFPGPPVAVDPEQMVRRILTIQGLHNYTPRDLAAAVAFLAAGHQQYPFADLVEQTWPLSAANEAFAAAEATRAVRLAVRPDGDCR